MSTVSGSQVKHSDSAAKLQQILANRKAATHLRRKSILVQMMSEGLLTTQILAAGSRYPPGRTRTINSTSVSAPATRFSPA